MRTSAYSNILLSEAIRQLLSPKLTVTFLRIFLNTLLGLCSPSESLNTQLGVLTDKHIKNAISWIEAFLDGNFSAIAMQTFVDSGTRSTLINAMVLSQNYIFIFIILFFRRLLIEWMKQW